ncbi:hypothetical protein HYH03_003022 [Edaphochlamys debaryana]|uniref:Uncharacterized protein n=1 Tax=Edaphochlamys debaryana TaxID=47281 RepID=A0A835YJI9_9CHLO|nr:hypothetical protein HYH03_003022 [Edaphochlamys debaryana]|eukprot:KAG2498829.1 hypothetical protein HYH03_003022 [Edaphochlamys debaryana]
MGPPRRPDLSGSVAPPCAGPGPVTAPGGSADLAAGRPPAPQPPQGAAMAGLNPALASFLGLRMPARLGSFAVAKDNAEAGACAEAASAAAPGASSGGGFGPGVGAEPPVARAKPCSACGSAPRQAAVLHSASEGRPAGACYCLYGGCSAAFVLGAPCPVCGEPGERVMKVYGA